jgi:HD-GYP domain-containing protein (c-di-GMP phosphodiesterase class II)
VLAVCDVFDALISQRVYRNAWSQADALALLHREAGTKLDPRCVEALERVLAREAIFAEPEPRLTPPVRPVLAPR